MLRSVSILHPSGTSGNAYVILYVMTKVLSYTESRAHYASTLDAVTDDREEVIITRAGKPDVVMISRDDYESLRETAYLLASPANAARLLRSVANLEASHGVEHAPVDE